MDFCKKHICSMTAAAVKCFSSRYCALLIFVTLMPHTGDINGHSPQLTSCLFSSFTIRSKPHTPKNIGSMYQSGSRSSSASWCSAVCTTKHPSTSSTSASLSPVSPPDNIFALPAEVFSSCLAIVSAVRVGGLFLWPALRYGTGYQTVREIWPSAETPSSVH